MTQLTSTWDETRFLDGYPGEYCCMARRKGNTWFIAGINAGKAQKVSLKLPNIKGGNNSCLYRFEERLESFGNN